MQPQSLSSNSIIRAKYNRALDLDQLLGLSGADLDGDTLPERLQLIDRLRDARRLEARRGLSGSWLYDMNRHLSLCAALRVEERELGERLTAEALKVERDGGAA